MQDLSDKRPFHETVVDAIRIASSVELQFLGSIIRETNIPGNHDQIIAAWNKRRKELCWDDDEDFGIPEDLLYQKRVATGEFST